jgi:hypothetical protein
MSLSLGEIARRIFKPRWADEAQFQQAMRAYARLDAGKQQTVESMGAKYRSVSK